MTKFIAFFLCALIGYLLGSIESAVIISRDRYHDDVRTHGSGNSGSTNMLRTYGKKAALMTFVIDCAKGVASVLLSFLIAHFFKLDNIECGSIGALFAVVGHCFPLYFGFKGGKGAATTLAACWTLFFAPTYGIIGIVAIAIAATVILLTRYVSLAVMITMLAFTAYVAVLYNSNVITLVCVSLICVLIIARHNENIKRLIKGNENKISFKKSKA